MHGPPMHGPHMHGPPMHGPPMHGPPVHGPPQPMYVGGYGPGPGQRPPPGGPMHRPIGERHHNNSCCLMF